MPKRHILAFAMVVSVLLGLGTSSSADPYYEGKTITILVSSSPGGGTDTTARLVSRFLPKFIPGNPQTIVQNMPGGGGTTSNNYFTRKAKPNGLMLFQDSSSGLGNFLRGGKRIKYNPLKYTYIGSINRGGSVLLIRKNARSRLTNPEAEPVVVGDSDGIRTWLAMTVWGAKYLGWNARWIVGYPGTAEMVLALRQGEIEMWGTGNAKLIQDLRQDGVVEPLAQIGQKRREDFPNVPTFIEVLGENKPEGLPWKAYQLWVGATEVDKFLVAPEGTPDEITQILRDAWNKMVVDPNFKKGAEKFYGQAWTARDAAKTLALAKEATDSSPEVSAFLRKIRLEHGLPVGKKKKR